MLNKDICKKCINENDKWNVKDDNDWDKKQIVVCIHHYHIKTIEAPPKKCKYKLEHLVLDEKNI